MPYPRVRRVAARSLAVLLASLVALAAGRSAAGDAVEVRARAILSGMSLEEKIGQLSLVPNSPSFDFGDLERGLVGGVLAFNNGPDIARAQAAARKSRHAVPLLVGLDILHGARTMFPLPMGEAASFDPALARETARQAAREASALGINWTFAPMADLARDPRWGRAIEGFGEDPHLGSVLTAARVAGFRDGGLATSLKHFAAYGASVGGRDYDAVSISGVDLHNLYLPPFRAGLRAGAESVMGGFHTLNGVPATANSFLLHDILRRSWGFDGFVTSDWVAIEQLIDHGVVSGPAEAARTALLAGMDVDMASGLYARHLGAEVAAGRVPEAAIDEAALRVLRTKLRMGLWEKPGPQPGIGEAPPPSAAIRDAARVAARDSMVLLRNDGILPLSGPRRIALIGGMATSREDPVGPHAALWRLEDTVTISDALRRRVESAGGSLAQATGCDAFCTSAGGFDAAVEAAAASDLVVAVMGEPIAMTGEGGSRAHLTLPGRQGELLRRLVETGRPVILVLMASRPIELGPVVDRLGALLMAWYPGTEGGNALADILFGDAEPSGKLPITWPRTVGQVPVTYDRLPTGRPHEPGNRYTLRYSDETLVPLFPFGFGKTYTTFALSDLTVISPKVGTAGELEVRATLANVGSRRGREVVQLYVRQPIATISQPMKRLKAFAKVALDPGARQGVTLKVPASDLGYFREDGSYVLEPGGFQVFLGTSSDTVLSGAFEVTR